MLYLKPASRSFRSKSLSSECVYNIPQSVLENHPWTRDAALWLKSVMTQMLDQIESRIQHAEGKGLFIAAPGLATRSCLRCIMKCYHIDALRVGDVGRDCSATRARLRNHITMDCLLGVPFLSRSVSEHGDIIARGETAGLKMID